MRRLICHRLNNRPLTVRTGLRLPCVQGGKSRTVHVEASAGGAGGSAPAPTTAVFVRQSDAEIVYKSPAKSHANSAANGTNGYH